MNSSWLTAAAPAAPPPCLPQLAEEKALDLSHVRHFVVDECDKCLESIDMRADVQAIFKRTPHDKQVMMFSATLSQDIRPVCKKFMRDVRGPWRPQSQCPAPASLRPPSLRYWAAAPAPSLAANPALGRRLAPAHRRRPRPAPGLVWGAAPAQASGLAPEKPAGAAAWLGWGRRWQKQRQIFCG